MVAVTRDPGPPSGPVEFVAPQNQEAEESVLGALMISAGAAPAAAEEISHTDFYRRSHGLIFRAALALHAQGDPIDAITLVAELERRGELEEVGGKIRISELAVLVPAASNVRHYARLVKECSVRRSLLTDLQQLSQRVLSGEWDIDSTVETLRSVADARAADTEPEQALRFMGLREFIDQPLAGVEPLLGEGKDRLLVEGSFNIIGGPGGVGKTTLALHLAAHLCAGKPWLDIPVQRPVRIVLLEVEGPHDQFAEKVKEFVERWDGEDFCDQMSVYDAPWGQFSWDDKRKATELRSFCRDFEADFVVANPLSRLGMKGAGTPEETNAFMNMLYRSGMGEDFGTILIHHTKKPPAGANGNSSSLDDLSGAWAAQPDLALLLKADGKQRVKLSVEKARWGDKDAHGPFILYFETNPEKPVGYKSMEATERIEDGEILERVDEFLRMAGPRGITEIRQNVVGKSNRISAMVVQAAADGRYMTDGRLKPKYWLPDVEPYLIDTETGEILDGTT